MVNSELSVVSILKTSDYSLLNTYNRIPNTKKAGKRKAYRLYLL